MADDRFVVVGLGNPGKTYSGNRHNVGAMIADVLAARMGTGFKSHKSGADVLDGRLAGIRVVLAKPRSYMNLSGAPVAALSRFFSIDPAQVVALHDELDLPYGTIRVKFGGGEGGHNGLRSVTKSVGTRDYLRVRVGIGRPPGRMDPADYVLHDFSGKERTELPMLVSDVADAVELLVAQGLGAAQQEWHSR